MKVNPSSDEKLQLIKKQANSSGIGQSGLQSLSRSNRIPRGRDKHACNKLLKKIVEGRAAILIMSSVTLYALFGVSFSILWPTFRMIFVYGSRTKTQMYISTAFWYSPLCCFQPRSL